MKRIRFLIAAVLLLCAAVPSYAGSAKKGWTKVVLTHAHGGAGEFPPGLVQRFGGEMLVTYGSRAFAYVPANAVAALTVAANKAGIAVAHHDEFDFLNPPGSARFDVRQGPPD